MLFNKVVFGVLACFNGAHVPFSLLSFLSKGWSLSDYGMLIKVTKHLWTQILFQRNNMHMSF